MRNGSPAYRGRARWASEGEKPPHPSCPLTAAWAQVFPPNRSPAPGATQLSAELPAFRWGLAACQGKIRHEAPGRQEGARRGMWHQPVLT